MADTYEAEAQGIAEDAEREARYGHHDADISGRIDPAARALRRERLRRRLSPKSTQANLAMILQWENRKPSVEDVETSLRADAQRWREKANRLRDELGPSFLQGTWENREALVRLWRHRYKKRGLLTIRDRKGPASWPGNRRPDILASEGDVLNDGEPIETCTDSCDGGTHD
jgi:hypothetical protein